MAKLGEYIICVCCAALLCGIVNSMMPKGTSREILKLVGGLFLAFTVIQPIQNMELPDLSTVTDSWQDEVSNAVSRGEEMARQAAADSIKKELEAYILDKALSLRLEVRVQLKLREDTLHPESVILIGNPSPDSRNQLTRWICEELGLTKEAVTWIS